MRRTVYGGDAGRLTLPTSVGEITVLDNHEPYVTILSAGKLRYEVAGAEAHLVIKGGFLEVREGNEVRVLADE